MKKAGLFLAVILMALTACNNKDKFHVEGSVSGAYNKTLYLEAEGLDSISVLDSTKLDSKGNFKFNGPRPECPEFYRLRLGHSVIHFSIDSTETVVINAKAKNFTTSYTVKGSKSCNVIKELTLKQMKLQEAVDLLQNDVKLGRLDDATANDSVDRMMSRYKEDIMKNYIYKEPNKPYAYFALFQRINNYLLFDPNDKKDIKSFQAVATSLDAFYHNSIRSKNLYNITIKGLQSTYTGRRRVINLPQNKISSAGLIDISLQDIEGQTHRLTDMKGKVGILDFVILGAKGAAQHNFKLRDIYNKYKAQGLEIYQISLDADEHYWKTAADNLPWICVRDGNGVQSNNVALYNVTSVPTMFVISRANEVKMRITNINQLESAIKAQL
jgi:hypothetical protein